MGSKSRLHRFSSGVRGLLSSQDVLLGLVLGVLAALASLALSGSLLPTFYARDSFDVWFEADLPGVYDRMTSRFAPSRSEIHPLFHIAVFPATRLLSLLGVDSLHAIRLVLASFSALWAATLFLTLRAIGCKSFDAVIFALLGLSSASAVFFLAAPETFLVGSVTISLAILLAAHDEHGERSPVLEAFVSAGTLSIAVTNWMVGLLSAFFRRRPRDFVQISLNALVICVLIWSVQKQFFPDTQFFLGSSYDAERSDHILTPEAEGLAGSTAGFFAHSMVMPEIQVVSRPSTGAWPILLTQPSAAMSSGFLGDVATGAWFALFAIGFVALLTLKRRPRLRLLLGTALAGQLLLHTVFGNETFLYSMHWMPLLITIASLATLTRWRPLAVALAMLICVSGGANNLLQFRESITFLEKHEPIIEERRTARRGESRQEDPRPGKAIPVTGRVARGYDIAAFESGAGLWPSMDTFNVGFWVTDASRQLIATNHGLDAADTNTNTLADGSVQIDAVTPYYEAHWESPERRVWRLQLKPTPEEGQQLFVMLRGVGWDWSHIYSVRVKGGGILINNRWRVSVEPRVERLEVGVEGKPGWLTESTTNREAWSAGGWGFARIGPLAGKRYELTVIDEGRNGSVDVPLGVLSYDNPSSGLFVPPLDPPAGQKLD